MATKNFKKNCFAAKDGCCAVLKYQPSCKGCKFFKTQEQLDEEKIRTHQRLLHLSEAALFRRTK